MAPDAEGSGPAGTHSGHPLWRLTLVALLLAVGQRVAATPAEEMKVLLERMTKALATLNYSGTLVYLHDNQLESMTITHRVRGDQEEERLVSLNGPPREVHRDQRAVTCVMPDMHAISIDSRVPGAGLWPARHLDADLLAGHYLFHPLEASRVAGREVRVIGIVPKDDLRYGYRFYLDKGTGLPLKTDLMDHGARPIEQIMFTSLDLAPPEMDIPPPQDDMAAQHGFRRMLRDPPKPQIPERPPAWAFGDLPPGFKVQLHNHWLGEEGQQVEHFVLGDGLAALSLYVESNSKDGLQGGAHVGTIHAWGRRIDGHQVTAVGEVPEKTVQWVIDALRKPPGDPPR